MPIINVNLIDTFDQWRIKTNTISNSFGDLSLLGMVGGLSDSHGGLGGY